VQYDGRNKRHLLDRANGSSGSPGRSATQETKLSSPSFIKNSVVLGLSVLVDDLYWFVLINSLSYYWKKRCQLTTENHEGEKKNNNHFSIAAGAVE
jgi:hypothetical protein